MFEIMYRRTATDDLARLRAFERVMIIAAIEKHLSHDPHVMGGVKKRIERSDGNFIYQLRAGAFRVFYDVDVEVSVTVVERVKRKDRKTTGEIL